MLYIILKIISKVIVISHKACLKMLMIHQVQPQSWWLALKYGSYQDEFVIRENKTPIKVV